MTPRRAHRGFTLLEMLAATVMAAMLAGSLYASLLIAFRARRSALGAVDFQRACDLSLDLIEADLKSATVPNGILAGAFVGLSGSDLAGGLPTPGGLGMVSFSSQGDSLSFYATGMDAEPVGGVGEIRKVEYVCEPSSDTTGMLLVRRVTHNLLAPRTPEPGQEIVTRAVRAFCLRYYDGSAWQANWDSTTQGNVLPKAVEVSIGIEGAPGQEVRWAWRIVPLPCGQFDEASNGSSSAQETP